MDIPAQRAKGKTESRLKKRRGAKLIHEGQYVATVEVELLETDEAWTPYLSMEDACRLDDARKALRQGDVKTAAQYGKVYALTPVAG